MKQYGCTTCLALDKDCGGHWSRRHYQHSYSVRTPKTTLDTYDAAHLVDNADYSVYEEDGE